MRTIKYTMIPATVHTDSGPMKMRMETEVVVDNEEEARTAGRETGALFEQFMTGFGEHNWGEGD